MAQTIPQAPIAPQNVAAPAQVSRESDKTPAAQTEKSAQQRQALRAQWLSMRTRFPATGMCRR